MGDYIAIREDGRWECPHCGGQIDTFADSETVASIVTAAVEAERARIVSADALPEYVHQLSIERITRAIKSLRYAEEATNARDKAIHLRRADESIMYARRSAQSIAAHWREYNERARRVAALTSAAPALDADDPRPCRGQNANVCVAEGCYGEACMGSRTTDETERP